MAEREPFITPQENQLNKRDKSCHAQSIINSCMGKMENTPPRKQH